MLKKYFVLILMFCFYLYSNASNITSKVLLKTDKVSINKGTALKLLAPANSKGYRWTTRTPYAREDEIFIYMPWKGGAKLSHIKAIAKMEKPQTITLSIWDGVNWIKKANNNTLDFKFKGPITAYAVKFTCSGMGKSDHERFFYVNWNIIAD